MIAEKWTLPDTKQFLRYAAECMDELSHYLAFRTYTLYSGRRRGKRPRELCVRSGVPNGNFRRT
jgi:hypothetical protein